jgi:outer membrane protein assembly factor BamB
VASIIALAACSGTSSSSSSSGTGNATIDLWTHNGGNDAELAVDQKIVDDFNASQTQYKVKLTSFPQASYNDAIVAAATAKKLPCVVDIDSPNVPNWAWAGYLAPLDLPTSTFDGQLPSTMGTIDGKVYSYGATTGELRWSHTTGSYVYSSPAVWRLRVYIGSHDGHLYSFDAATGDVRWSFDAHGVISGSPTVIDGVVYFSTARNRTYALNAVTGKLLWHFPDGQYTPVVAEPGRLFLIGSYRVYGMVPR